MRELRRRGVRLAPWARLTVALLVALGAGSAGAQLSPGPLSAPHAGLEGSTNCLSCHAPREGVARDRCLDCHTALARSIADGGLHRRPEYQQCETCHIEHHGREFELIFWGEEGRQAFDHSQTGWRLEGSHDQAACRDCHRPAHLEDVRRLEQGGADPQKTFLGLEPSCLSCHRDEHRGQLGRDRCLDCHTTNAWKPAPGFDHSTTDFQLTGAHGKVACGECHPTREESGALAAADSHFLVFRGLAHQSCADCHEDPHRGRLGASCSNCHNTEDFRRVDRAAFDHDRTRFPLRGEHRNATCNSCHGSTLSSGGASRRLAFGSCSDCHSDPHRGRFGESCSSCHDPSGWRSSGWRRVEGTGFDHDRTRFPLRGEHREVACSSCHGSRPSAQSPSQDLSFGACSDCHSDPHLGQLRAASGGGACSDCHTVAGFVPSTFALEDHQRTDFPLQGAHQAVACIDCHRLTEADALPRPLRPVSPRHALPGRAARRPTEGPVRRFRFADTACTTCHLDPHDGETAAVAETCSDCHTLDGWSQVAFTDPVRERHAALGFPLGGAHAGVTCNSCHPPADPARPASLSFAATDQACAACHRDPHFGTGDATVTQRVAAVDCASCHGTGGFRPASFDHRRETGFVLEGAHRQLACAACHDPGEAGGETRIAQLPNSCEGCHGGTSVISRSSTGSHTPQP